MRGMVGRLGIVRPYLWIAILAVMAGGWLPASAQTGPNSPVDLGQMTLGYTYYNRPGADLAVHNRDVLACAAEAAKVLSLDEAQHQQSLAPMGLMIASHTDSPSHRGAVAASLENCMVVRGWRVVRLPDAEGEADAALAPAQLTALLAPWVGADNPHGEIVRVWNNDAASGLTHRLASIIIKHTVDGQLSLLAASGQTLTQFHADPESLAYAGLRIPDLGFLGAPVRSREVKSDPKWTRKFLSRDQLGQATAEEGVIVIRLRGNSLTNGGGLQLTRIGATPDAWPSTTDNAPDIVDADMGGLFNGRDGKFMAVAVPPGRWRIFGIIALSSIDFCLGAPSFEVKAGEVVYAGTFDLMSNSLGPDLDLGPPKAWLSGGPEAERIRAAVYTNGSLGPCGDNGIYALEISRAPFEPSYRWGGAAATPTNATVSATVGNKF